MALRDQPYLPLYVDDFMSDEKLNLCSAEATGVYIRLMCLMHKMDEYGVITLTKLDKVCDDQIRNFAVLLSKQMPYEIDLIYRSICELFERKVIQIKGDKLMQKRMVKDAEMSKKRAIAGSKGGKQKSSKSSSKVSGESQANSVNEIVNENIYKDLSTGKEETNGNDKTSGNESRARAKAFKPPTVEEVREYCRERGNSVDSQRFVDFYSSKGWYVGKNKMKDWKAAIRTWERDEPERKAEKKKPVRVAPPPTPEAQAKDYERMQKYLQHLRED